MADSFAQEPQIILKTKLFTRSGEIGDERNTNDVSYGGIALNSKLAWTVTNSDSCLEMWNTSTGELLGSWSAPNKCSITCVEEVSPNSDTSLLVVGLDSDGGRGGLAIVNPNCAAAVRRILLDFTVSSIHCLSSGQPVPNVDVLEHFQGVVAAGGRGGNLMLIDLQLDQVDDHPIDIHPKSLLVITEEDEDLETLRNRTIANNQVLAVDMTSQYRSDTKFSYRNSNASKSLLMEVENSRAFVTTVYYIPQLLTLFVGYNFGGFQLYHMRTLDIVCTSKADNPTTLDAVSGMAYQEPDDDPRLCIYLWVVYSSRPFEYRKGDRSRIVLYQLHYKDREYSEEVGFIYRHLQGCMPRFEHLFGPTPKPALASNQGDQGVKTRVIFCKTLSHLRKQKRVNFEDKTVDCGNMTLAAFVWTSERPREPSSLRSYVGLFDLNQWYHAQMPVKVSWKKKGPGEHLPLLGCEYFAFFSVLDGHSSIRGEKIQSVLSCDLKNLRFLNTPPPTPEIHMWPSSLSFDMDVLVPKGNIQMTFCGLQRTVLQKLCYLGSRALTDLQNQSDLSNRARIAELLCVPEFDERTLSHPKIMRMALLDLALEHGNLSVVDDCITEWSDSGTDPDGCTLPFLLDWASDRLGRLIQEKDKNSAILLGKDLYGEEEAADPITCSQLCQQAAMFDSLASIFNKLYSVSQSMLEERGVANTREGEGDLLSRVLAAEIHSKYTKVLLWSFAQGLLPYSVDNGPLLHPVVSTTGRGKPLIAAMLKAATQNSSVDLEYPIDNFEVLLDLHMDFSSDTCVADYVMMYYLYDVMDANQTEEEQEDLAAGYQESFLIKARERKAVRSLWTLDNLLDNLKGRTGGESGKNIAAEVKKALHFLKKVKVPLFKDQHSAVLSSFMDAGLSKCALKYFESCKNCIHLDLEQHRHTFEVVVGLLVGEGLLHQALELCMNYAGSEAEEDCYSLLLKTCNKSRKLSQLVSLELSQEETVFVWNYLDSVCSSVEHKELLVLALVKWGYLQEAAALNDHIQSDLLVGDVQKRANDRRVVIEGLVSCEPEVVRDVWSSEMPVLKEVTVGTLTSVIAQKIRPNPLTTASLLESIMMARTQGPKTPLLPHSRWSMTMTPTTRSISATPTRCTPSVLGKRLVSSTVRTPTRPSAEAEKRLLTPKRPPSASGPLPSSMSRNSIAALKTRLCALKSSFTLPPELCTPSLRTPVSSMKMGVTSQGSPTPRSILKRVVPKPTTGGFVGADENQDMDTTDSGANTRRITFAKSPSPIHVSRGNTPNSPDVSAIGSVSSGEESFSDAVDHFPGQDSIAHQLKYGDGSIDKGSLMPEKKDESSTLPKHETLVQAQLPAVHQSPSLDTDPLARKSLDSSGSTSSVLDIHLSDSESDFMESSFEKEGKKEYAPLDADQTFGQHSLRTSLERKSIFWERSSQEHATSLPPSLYPQGSLSAPGSRKELSPLMPGSQRTYRFISQEAREKMLSPISQRASAVANKSSSLSVSSSKTTLSSLVTSSQSSYSFRPPVPKSPPPSEDKDAESSEPILNVTPVKPFVFSPPFTRSATREKKATEFARTSGLLGSADRPKDSATKPTRHDRSKRKSSSRSESIGEEETPSRVKGKGRQTGDVPSRSPVPVRRSKRLLTKK